MTREQASEYVSFVVDDALNGRRLGDDQFAVVRPTSRLIGWQCGFEPLFVSVHSYIDDIRLDDDEAIELATDYLAERNWFADYPPEPDYVI
jgi:hypothetical protein